MPKGVRMHRVTTWSGPLILTLTVWWDKAQAGFLPLASDGYSVEYTGGGPTWRENNCLALMSRDSVCVRVLCVWDSRYWPLLDYHLFGGNWYGEASTGIKGNRQHFIKQPASVTLSLSFSPTFLSLFLLLRARTHYYGHSRSHAYNRALVIYS